MVKHRKTETAQRFGAMLRQARERLGLPQKALGERLGVKQSQVSNVEAGVDMRLSTLENFARYLGYELLLVPRERVRDAVAVSTASAFTPSGALSGLHYFTPGALGPIFDPSLADELTQGSAVIPARRSMFATGGVIDDDDDDDDGEREG